MSHISNQSAGTFGGTILAIVGVVDPSDMHRWRYDRCRYRSRIFYCTTQTEN